MIHVVGSGGRGSGFNFDYPLQAHPRPPILTFSTLSIFYHCPPLLVVVVGLLDIRPPLLLYLHIVHCVISSPATRVHLSIVFWQPHARTRFTAYFAQWRNFTVPFYDGMRNF